MSTGWKPIDSEGHVDPESVTHIIFLGDSGMPKISSEDASDFARIYQRMNPEMWDALPPGVPISWVYVKRTNASGTIDPNHFMGSHLDKLGVPESSSVFVQLISVAIEGAECPVTLETVVRTREPICVVSEKSPIPRSQSTPIRKEAASKHPAIEKSPASPISKLGIRESSDIIPDSDQQGRPAGKDAETSQERLKDHDRPKRSVAAITGGATIGAFAYFLTSFIPKSGYQNLLDWMINTVGNDPNGPTDAVIYILGFGVFALAGGLIGAFLGRVLSGSNLNPPSDSDLSERGEQTHNGPAPEAKRHNIHGERTGMTPEEFAELHAQTHRDTSSKETASDEDVVVIPFERGVCPDAYSEEKPEDERTKDVPIENGYHAGAMSSNVERFPLFLFDWQVISERQSSEYGIYARREIKRRLRGVAPVVLDPNWRGWDGDMLYPDTMVQLLSIGELSPDLTLIKAEAADKLKSGSLHTIYLLGIGNTERDIICRIHRSLTQDNIVGYLGAVLFAALHPSDIIELMSTLALPPFDWWNL